MQTLRTRADVVIRALGRDVATSNNTERLSWFNCDLNSQIDLENALEGVDVAFYLVHSMLPSAQLDQGKFQDRDLILADNFARVAKKKKVRQIVYLGGILPTEETGLSWHLKSRLEVEQCLAQSGVPVTTFRAGLIIGARGSSFRIMTNLVRRLPLMVCPGWTLTSSSPISIHNVVDALDQSILREEAYGQIYDLAGPETFTYVEMMRRAAEIMGKRRFFIKIPYFSLRLSRYWVSLITGSPKNLVYPLVLSLKYDMIPSPARRWPHFTRPLIDFKTSTLEGLKGLAAHDKVAGPPPQRTEHPKRRVRSVQRLPLPAGKHADWVGYEYMRWLPHWGFPFLRVETIGDTCIFWMNVLNLKLLVLERSLERSTNDRQIFYIKGGLLAQQVGRGRLEFREALKGEVVLAAVHDFVPSLPWGIYRVTQAIVHLVAMQAFGRHLSKIKTKI